VHARDLGKALSVAIVDYSGFVVLIERMDGARPMTPDIALSKAWRCSSTPARSTCSPPRPRSRMCAALPESAASSALRKADLG
jgi:Haem-degrading